MAEQTANKPVEKAKGQAEQAARADVISRPKREQRTYLFEIGLLAVVGAFTTLTALVKTTPSFPIDLQITRTLQSFRSPIFDALMNLISWPGFTPQAYIIAIFIALAWYWFGFHWEAVASLVATVFTPIVNVLVKEYIQRPRPGVDVVEVFRILDSYSFPSGHVMYYVGFFGFMWFLVYTLLKRSWHRSALLIVVGVFVALIGASRIYLGQHWASDVLGAYLLGSLTLAIVLWFYRWGKKRFFVRQPAAPETPKTAA